ncbi:unnamed protein product [Trichogramma brassicae]|uniref:Uncharacterized protein n=1 Tax=Trichogramma brassicae TaxID=86971 RepID=A0A6H5IYU3_9HYME|nr:unnamed protein product [Trichogramma brassicae]
MSRAPLEYVYANRDYMFAPTTRARETITNKYSIARVWLYITECIYILVVPKCLGLKLARAPCTVQCKTMAQNAERQLVQLEERDYRGRTPLHYAIISGNKDSIKLLLRNGADPNSADNWGNTPAPYLQRRTERLCLGKDISQDRRGSQSTDTGRRPRRCGQHTVALCHRALSKRHDQATAETRRQSESNRRAGIDASAGHLREQHRRPRLRLGEDLAGRGLVARRKKRSAAADRQAGRAGPQPAALGSAL